MKRALISYINPYVSAMSDATDEYEYGMISEEQYDEKITMYNLMQKYGIYPYSDLELRHIAERGDMVQPRRNMCRVVGGPKGVVVA